MTPRAFAIDVVGAAILGALLGALWTLAALGV